MRRLTTAWKSVPSTARPDGGGPPIQKGGDASRVLSLDQVVLVDALAETGDLEPIELVGLDGGHVDVDELARREAVLEDVPGDDGRGSAGQREIGVLVVLLRDGEGRAVVDDRLHRRADRPRVGDVVTQVGAVVDAGGDEVEGRAQRSRGTPG